MWACCRVGLTEAARAVGRVAGARALARVHQEWAAFTIVEVDAALTERAAELAVAAGLGALDALHLASALMLPRDDLTLVTWDPRLHVAAQDRGLTVLPETLPEPAPVPRRTSERTGRFAPAT